MRSEVVEISVMGFSSQLTVTFEQDESLVHMLRLRLRLSLEPCKHRHSTPYIPLVEIKIIAVAITPSEQPL